MAANTCQPSSETVANVFLEEHGLKCERFAKDEVRQGKTPDFRVFLDEQMVMYCEVKEIREDDRIDQLLDQHPTGTTVMVGGNDSTYNRVSAKIHDAVQQFDAVNPSHEIANVLFLVNFEVGVDVQDLHAVLTGYLPTDGGGKFKGFGKYSNGRIAEEKTRIDLYLWRERDSEIKFTFVDDASPHAGFLRHVFGKTGDRGRRI